MILGLRCSGKDYAFAIVEGTTALPILVKAGLIPFPRGFSRVQSAYWFYQELNQLLDAHECSEIVIRGSEARVKGNSFVERVEHESMSYVAAARKGIKLVTRKVRSTIAKDLGLKGRARYLETTLDSSVIPLYNGLDEKVQEAVQCGWSGLS